MTGMIPGLPQFNANMNQQGASSSRSTTDALSNITNLLNSTFADDAGAAKGAKDAKKTTDQVQTGAQKTVEHKTPEEVLAQLAGVLTEDEIKTKKKNLFELE